MIASRAECGMQLYLSKRQLIVRTGEEFYLVPGSGRRSYKVRYGGTVESCEMREDGRMRTPGSSPSGQSTTAQHGGHAVGYHLAARAPRLRDPSKASASRDTSAEPTWPGPIILAQFVI
jgi:hypothetical protein